MSYILHESFDFGITYIPTTFSETLLELEVIAKRMPGDRRWVISEGDNKPIKWCGYIQSLVDASEENKHNPNPIATDDPFATQVLLSTGRKVITSAELYKKITGKDMPPTPSLSDLPLEEKLKILKGVRDMAERGIE